MKKLDTVFRNKVDHIHFVGIGGIGMSGIAEIMLDLGYKVTGSDLRNNDNTDRLKTKGAHIYSGHNADYVSDADVVVYSSAVKFDNPEIISAKSLKIPVIPRAEMLAELMRFSEGVAVAGTHGKTTTTSLMATVLTEGGLDPTVIIGGKLNSIGTNAKYGKGKIMLAEADESDKSFLFLRPVVTCVTNIDKEHMDNYKDLDEIINTFKKFMSNIPFYGFNIVCIDNQNIRKLSLDMHRKLITYGISHDAQYRAKIEKTNSPGSRFKVFYMNKELGEISIKMAGEHNVLNSLAALVLGMETGLNFNTVKRALEGFEGVDRRFSIRGEAEGVMFVDDYGHHPTEIAATLAGAREGYKDKRIIAVFQPHRYSRVKHMYSEFASAFAAANELVITDIYPAGEIPLEGINSENLSEDIRKNSKIPVHYTGSLEQTLNFLKDYVKEGDLVLTLGAGSVTQIPWKLLDILNG